MSTLRKPSPQPKMAPPGITEVGLKGIGRVLLRERPTDAAVLD